MKWLLAIATKYNTMMVLPARVILQWTFISSWCKPETVL